MVNGATPKPLGDLAGAFLVAMVAGGVLLGWVRNRGRRESRGGISGDGWLGDDGAHHHGSIDHAGDTGHGGGCAGY